MNRKHLITSCLCAGKTELQTVRCMDKPHAERVASVNGGEVKRNSLGGWDAILYKRLALVWEHAPKDDIASWVRLTEFCKAEGWHAFRVLGDCQDPLGLVRRTLAANEHNGMPINIEETP